MPVVFAVLAGIFLLMIIFQWGGQGDLFNTKSDSESMGTVNGFKITKKLYDRMYAIASDKMKKDGKKTSLTDAEEDKASEQAWDEAVKETITQQSMEKMHIVVTDQEVRDALFETPPQEIQRAFSDSMGVFHQKEYFQWLRDPKNDTIVRQLDQDVRDQLRHIKWQEVMISTIRATDNEAHNRYLVDSAKVLVQVVKMPAPPVAKDLTKVVSDKDVQDYYDSHLWRYKQDESRKFKFVVFRLLPNARDTALAMETARSITARLAEAPLASIDTVVKDLAGDYSDDPVQPRHPVSQRELGDDTTLWHKKAGDVAVATIARRVTAVRILNVSDTGHPMYRVRHISISAGASQPNMSETVANAHMDSALVVAQGIMNQLRAGADFAEVARTKSRDAKSALKGGDLGWNEVPPIASMELVKALPTTPMNGLIGPLRTTDGYEIVQITGHTTEKWDIIGIPLSIKASHQTLLMHQQMANVFRDQAVKVGFDEAAKSSGNRVETEAPAAARKGTPIFSSHSFVDWIFDAAKGDISPVMKMVQQNFLLVAQLTEITPAGPKPLADVKQTIMELLAKRKAVESLSGRATQIRSMIGSDGDLFSLIAKTGDSSFTPVTVLMGPAESVIGLPTEEYVVNNWAYAAKPGEISPPLKGNSGYYIAKLLEQHIPTDAQFKDSRKAMMQKLFQEREQRLMTEWVESQRDNAKIVDYRVRK